MTTQKADMPGMTRANQNMAWEYLKATMRQLGDRINNSSDDHLDLDLSVSVTTDSDIARGIIGVAENGGGDGTEVFGGCDIIAMTTHGYSGRQHWVGSVTERVLDTSRIPLLIVQPGA